MKRRNIFIKNAALLGAFTFLSSNCSQIVNADENIKIIKAIGTTSMTYAEYYAAELDTTADLINVAGEYDAVTTATKAVHAKDIPGIINYRTDTNGDGTGLEVSGIGTVDVYVDETALPKISEQSLEELKDSLKTLGVNPTYFIYSNGSIVDASGDPVTSLNISNVKELISEGSFGKSEKVENNTSTNFLNNGIEVIPKVLYGTNYGHFEIDLYYTNDGSTGMGTNCGNGWNDYKNNIYDITITDELGNNYGTVWYEDCWAEDSHGSYLQIAVNVADNTIKGVKLPFTRFTGLANGGNLTVTVKARGYEDVIHTVNVAKILSNKPSLNSSIIYDDEGDKATLSLNTTNVDTAYVQALRNGKLTLSKANTSGTIDVSSYISNISTDNQSIELALKELVTEFGAGTYSLVLNVDGYETVSLSFTIYSSLSQPSLKVGTMLYSAGIEAVAHKGDEILIVDKDGNFIKGYAASSVTVSINGETVPSRGPNAAKVLIYDETNNKLTIDTSSSLFEENGIYDIEVSLAGYDTFNYHLKLTSEEIIIPDNEDTTNPETPVDSDNSSLDNNGNSSDNSTTSDKINNPLTGASGAISSSPSTSNSSSKLPNTGAPLSSSALAFSFIASGIAALKKKKK